MIDQYLNTDVTYKKLKESLNEYNEADYEEEKTIKVNKQASSRYIRNVEGDDIQHLSLYFTSTKVYEGDILDGNLVIDVNEDKSLDGTIIGYEVYTR